MQFDKADQWFGDDNGVELANEDACWMQFDKAEQGFLHHNGVELANNNFGEYSEINFDDDLGCSRSEEINTGFCKKV